MSADSSPAAVSLCMIVRDCEQSLARALDSAGALADEMIVVDTGSADSTVEIAKQRGARVFHFDWCDDFSAARNYSLEQASGDWIFWMDGDDFLPPESARQLRRLATEHPQRDAAFWVHVEQELTDERGRRRTTRHGHVKLFPRHPKIRFCYRVHEQVTPSIRALGLPLKMTTAVIRHLHDRCAENTRRRVQRNLRLLDLDLADHPHDPFILLNLGMTLLHIEDGASRALECTEQSLARFKHGSPMRLNAYLIRATAHGRLGQVESELRTLAQARNEFPEDASLLLRLGGLYARQGDPQYDLGAAADCYRRILDGAALHASVLSFADVPARATLELGRLHVQQGKQTEARRLWSAWLEKRPKDETIRRALEQLAPPPAADKGDDRSDGSG